MRIILADHHEKPRLAMGMYLAEQSGFNLIGEVADAADLLLLADENPTDLILIDRELPGMNIEDLVTRLHALELRPIVVMMSSKFEDSRLLLNAGADAFVSKGDEPEWLLKKLHKYAKQINVEGGYR